VIGSGKLLFTSQNQQFKFFSPVKISKSEGSPVHCAGLDQPAISGHMPQPLTIKNKAKMNKKK